MDTLSPVQISEIESLLKSSNCKTCCLDPCGTRLLKDTMEAHLDPILAVFNASFRDGIFPSQFKTAVVRPLLKKPSLDPQQMKNFRPVSNLTFLGKVLEKLAVSRLNDHIRLCEKEELCQSAYKPFHSTESALLRVFNDVALHLDSRRVVLLAMIDLSAAFDTICHDQLLHLLDKEYGVRESALSWFSSYFRDRHQFVQIASFESDKVPLSSGCPQGSVLGPISFNLYTAPLARIIQQHGLAYHKYADDLQVYIDCSLDDIPMTKNKLEACLADIRKWMLRWHLKINDN